MASASARRRHGDVATRRRNTGKVAGLKKNAGLPLMVNLGARGGRPAADRAAGLASGSPRDVCVFARKQSGTESGDAPAGYRIHASRCHRPVTICQWQPKTAHFGQLKTAHFGERAVGRRGRSPVDAHRACWAGRRERSDRQKYLTPNTESWPTRAATLRGRPAPRPRARPTHKARSGPVGDFVAGGGGEEK